MEDHLEGRFWMCQKLGIQDMGCDQRHSEHGGTRESSRRNWPFRLIPRKPRLGQAEALVDAAEITSQSLHFAKGEKEKKRGVRAPADTYWPCQWLSV